MAENLLALAVKPLDVATPLLQARRIQQSEAETQTAQHGLRQAEMGSEFRGLAAIAGTPDFPQQWAASMDRLRDKGILDPQRHAQLRNSPSPLLLQQGLAMTSSPDQYLKMKELEQSQAASTNFGRTIAGFSNGAAPQPGAPAAPAASMLPRQPAPDDPTMSPAPSQVAAANGLPAPVAAAPAPRPNSDITFGDGVTVPNAPASSPIQPAAAPAPRSNNPATGRLDSLVAAVSQRGLPKHQFELGMEFIKREIENTKLTDAQKDYYNSYVPQQLAAGKTPKPFNEFDLERRRANAPPKAESEYDRHMAKVFTEYNQASINGASTARTQISSLSRLQQLLSNANVYQGTGGNFVANLKRLGASVGIDTSEIKDGAANADAIRSIANQFSLQLRNPAGGAGMPGALSDKDREFLQSMVAGLTGTPGGNKLIIDYMTRVAQRSIDVERERQKYVQKHGRLDEGFFRELQGWSDQNPLFSEADRTSATQNQGAEGGRSGTTKTRVNWRLGQ